MNSMNCILENYTNCIIKCDEKKKKALRNKILLFMIIIALKLCKIILIASVPVKKCIYTKIMYNEVV